MTEKKKPTPKPSTIRSARSADPAKLAAPSLSSAPKTHAYLALVDALLLQLPLTLDAEERAYYAGSISEADALASGARYESSGVLDDLLRLVGASLPHVVAGKVAGYGGLRLRYHVEIGAALAVLVERLDSSLVEAVGATAAKTTSLRGTRALRRAGLRALNNLAGRREEQGERVRRARRGSEKPDERARSLEVIAQELEAILAKVPPRVAADAGATPELMAELRQNARAVLVTRSNAQETHGAVRSIYDEMNLLDGRILHETRLLVGAMTDARAADKTIPFVRSSLLRKPSRKKIPRPAAPATAPHAEATAPNGQPTAP